jgi:hypothetical protein
MKTYKLAIGIASSIALGVVVYHIRKTKYEKRLNVISDAGYETAYDVIYPLKSMRLRRKPAM